jgi:hypothetical protein
VCCSQTNQKAEKKEDPSKKKIESTDVKKDQSERRQKESTNQKKIVQM